MIVLEESIIHTKGPTIYILGDRYVFPQSRGSDYLFIQVGHRLFFFLYCPQVLVDRIDTAFPPFSFFFLPFP